MKSKITNRDVKFFFLGVLAMLIFTIIYDWQDFKDGLNGGVSAHNESRNTVHEN